jgi:heme/copper-type cytochrome/quinol oxidase subunit 4
MSVLGWCQWLERTRLATAISESVWLFPIIEGSHILALPLSVGMILMFDLRLLGLAFQGGSASSLMRDVLRWSKVGFAVMFLTGVLLFMTQASKAYESVFFRAKLVFLLMLGLNAALFQVVFYPKMEQWAGEGTPLGARVCGALSLIVWIAVIICGRTMAYQF